MDKKVLKETLKALSTGQVIEVGSTDPTLDGTFVVKTVKLKRGHGGVDVTLSPIGATNEVLLSSVKNAEVVTAVQDVTNLTISTPVEIPAANIPV